MKVFFNASVILAGLCSPKGASGEILERVRKKEVTGEISELIFNEAVRHADKIGLAKELVEEEILRIFNNPVRAPSPELVEKYFGVVIDEGDAHVLASCVNEDCDTLVTLDKKHLLVLREKIEGVKIVSPGELLLATKAGFARPDFFYVL